MESVVRISCNDVEYIYSERWSQKGGIGMTRRGMVVRRTRG